MPLGDAAASTTITRLDTLRHIRDAGIIDQRIDTAAELRQTVCEKFIHFPQLRVSETTKSTNARTLADMSCAE